MLCHMQQKSINLLPNDYKRHVFRERWMRLSAFLLMLLSTIAIAGGILLAPSIFLARTLANTTALERETAERGLEINASVEGLPALRFIRQEIAFVRGYQKIPQPSRYVSEAADAASSAISLSGVVYRGGEENSVVVEGIARRRDDLIAYQKALGALSFFDEPEIPVSALAQSVDLAFSLTVPIRAEATQ